MKKKKSCIGIIRRTSQIIFFVFVALVALGKWLKELGIAIPLIPEASLHAICPFGGVVTVYEFFTEGTFIQKIHNSAFILMGLGFLVALLFGSIFCGYICPLGSFQEWIGKVGKKLFPKKYNKMIPAKVDNVLQYLRYVVLVLVLIQTALTAKLIFQDYDPYYALFNFFTGEVAVTAMIILAITIVLSLFVERPWCRYLCPYGSLLGLFNSFRIFKLHRDPASCISCSKCDKVCPMNIEVSKKEVVRSHKCISCHQCVSGMACPVENTVTITASKGNPEKLKLKPQVAFFIVLLVFAGGVTLTTATGLYRTTSTKVPAMLVVEGFQDTYDPNDIRGSYTFSEISSLFGIPAEDLMTAFGLSKNDLSIKLGKLESLYGPSEVEIGPASVRLFVAYYLELPYEPTEEAFLPKSASEFLLARGLDQERALYIKEHTASD